MRLVIEIWPFYLYLWRCTLTSNVSNRIYFIKTMPVNYSNFSLDKLKKEKAKIEKAISVMEVKDKKAAMAKVVALARESGIDLADLVGGSKRATKKVSASVAKTPATRKKKKVAAKKRGKVAPKYRNPEDSKATWTGRGKQPIWVRDYLANGGTLESVTI